MYKAKILIIDDDIDILTVLKANIELQGYEVFTAKDWSEGRQFIKENRPDLLILDLTLPDCDGLKICKEIRQERLDFPIIMLTARDKLSDKIIGLESGADDYIVKPFETLELLARIKVCLRRSKTLTTFDVVQIRDLTVDVKKKIVKVGGTEVILTPKEFNLLVFLISRKGEIVSRDEIKKHLWKEDQIYSWSRVIDVHIQHLRQKLDINQLERFIETVPSMGYRFIE